MRFFKNKKRPIVGRFIIYIAVFLNKQQKLVKHKQVPVTQLTVQ